MIGGIARLASRVRGFDRKLLLVLRDASEREGRLRWLHEQLAGPVESGTPVEATVFFDAADNARKRVDVVVASLGAAPEDCPGELCEILINAGLPTLIGSDEIPGSATAEALRRYRLRCKENGVQPAPVCFVSDDACPPGERCLEGDELKKWLGESKKVASNRGIKCLMLIAVASLVIVGAALGIDASTSSDTDVVAADRLIESLRADQVNGFPEAGHLSRSVAKRLSDDLVPELRKSLTEAVIEHHRAWIDHIDEVARDRPFKDVEVEWLVSIGQLLSRHIRGGEDTDPAGTEILARVRSMITERAFSSTARPEQVFKTIEHVAEHFGQSVDDETRSAGASLIAELARRYVALLAIDLRRRSDRTAVSNYRDLKLRSDEIAAMLQGFEVGVLADELEELRSFLGMLPLDENGNGVAVQLKPRYLEVLGADDGALAELSGDEADWIIRYYLRPIGREVGEWTKVNAGSESDMDLESNAAGNKLHVQFDGIDKNTRYAAAFRWELGEELQITVVDDDAFGESVILRIRSNFDSRSLQESEHFLPDLALTMFFALGIDGVLVLQDGAPIGGGVKQGNALARVQAAFDVTIDGKTIPSHDTDSDGSRIATIPRLLRLSRRIEME